MKKETLAAYQALIEAKLALALPLSQEYDKTILEAMNYSLLAGGKRLRPVLMMAACEAVGGEAKDVLEAASAIECIHSYSLIHDDLPAMDDDDLRRGKPTNHVVFGEGMAILAGDGLLTEAFALLSTAYLKKGEAEKGLRLVEELALASGVLGMVGGQAKDLLSEGQAISEEEMHYIHQKKTGALIRASVRMGAIIGNASEEAVEQLSLYGEKIGLAFQITDDILDIVGETKDLGKAVGSDEKNHKVTYPSLYGLEQSRVLAKEACEAAKGYLKDLSGNTSVLEYMIDYILARKK